MRGRIPAGVLEIKDGKSELANMHERLGFESCVAVCPTGAITVKKM